MQRALLNSNNLAQRVSGRERHRSITSGAGQRETVEDFMEDLEDFEYFLETKTSKQTRLEKTRNFNLPCYTPGSQ